MSDKQLQLNPAIDPIRVFQGVCTFDAFNVRHALPVINPDRARLVEAYLTFTALPTPQDFANPTGEFVGVNDLHVYLRFTTSSQVRTIDITDRVIAELQASLSSLGTENFSRCLKEGVEQRLQLIEQLHLTYTTEFLNKMRGNVDALTKQDSSKWMVRLGERKTENWIGTLHPVNFIYTYIPLPPVSINKVLAGVQQPHNPLLVELVDLQLIIAHGALAKDAEHNGLPGGRLVYCLECVYHNDLLDEFKSLEGEIDQQLKEMHAQLATDGPIVHPLTLAQGSLADALKELKDIEEIARDQKVQLESVGRTASQLQQRLDSVLAKCESVLAKCDSVLSKMKLQGLSQ
ncbi:MAG: hypothetical protein WAK29_21465 [Terriglobales bacterium]